MKILVDASSAVRPVTGIGTYAKELIRHLLQIDERNRYIIFSIKSPFPNRRLSFPFPNGKNVSHKSVVLSYSLLKILWNNLRLFPIENLCGDLEVVHSLDRTAPFTKKAKVIVTVHDMSWYTYDYGIGIKQLIHGQIIGTLERADRIITDSDFTKYEMIKYLPFTKDKVHVIEIGVSDRFHPIDRDAIPGEVHEIYPWNDYILYLGVLDDPRKNVESIVTAYAELKRKKRIKEKLLLCGKVSKYSKGLSRLIKKINLPDDIIIYTRWIPDEDVPYIYNKARLVLLPSLYEGFGLPVLEAMACGKPVITSDISPLREISSDAAILVNPKRQEEISDSIERLLSDDILYNSMVENGLKRSREFTWVKTAMKTLKLYEECASK